MKNLFEILIIMLLGISLIACDETEESTTYAIPASYMDTLQWHSDLLLPYSDATYGYDFSAQEHNNTSRDCYLDMSTNRVINAFLFDGTNHIKKYTKEQLSFTYPVPVPTSWDATNEALEPGMFYILECADGYVVMQVFDAHFDEFVINYSFVSTAMLEQQQSMNK